MKVFSQNEGEEGEEQTQTGGQAPEKQDPNKAPNKKQNYQEIVVNRKEEADKPQDEEHLSDVEVKAARQNTVKEIMSNNPNLGRPETDDTNAVESSDSSLDPKTAISTAEKEEEKKAVVESSPEQNQGLGNDKLGEGVKQGELPGQKEKEQESEEKKVADDAIEVSAKSESNGTANGEPATPEETKETTDEAA